MNKIKITLLIFITAFFFSNILVFNYGKKVEPKLYKYLEIEASSLANSIVDSTINDVLKDSEINDLFITNEINNQIYLDYNTQYVNYLLKKINKQLEENLNNLIANGTNNSELKNSLQDPASSSLSLGTIYLIPLKSINNNPFFINTCPKIPIKINFLGQISSSLKTNATSYGVNNTIYEAYLHTEISVQIITPLTMKKVVSTVEAPITIKIIQGEVPYYLRSFLEKNSIEVSLPISN